MSPPAEPAELSELAGLEPPLGVSGTRTREDPLIGRTVHGRFRILGLIARGGMGKVYRAEQAPLGRVCALKILNPKYEGDEDPEFQRRFLLEASTAARLSHANTVTVFDYGRDGDLYFIAMEYVPGRTLYRAIREDGPFSEMRVARVLRQVGRSLREAHQLGVIHRDIKPGNILLVDGADEPDMLKVLDFGLVKHVGEDAEEHDLTKQGLFMGSPKYMAPEQILGERVSAATDLYSLGVVAYELLSGQPPFDRGASLKTLMAHVDEPPPPLAKVRPEIIISEAMDRLVMRCLEKDPALRYQTVEAFLVDLSEVQAQSLGELPWPASTPAPATSWLAAPVSESPTGPSASWRARAEVSAHGSGAPSDAFPAGYELLHAPESRASASQAAPAPATISVHPAAGLPAIRWPRRAGFNDTRMAVAAVLIAATVVVAIGWSLQHLQEAAQLSASPITAAPNTAPEDPVVGELEGPSTGPEPAADPALAPALGAMSGQPVQEPVEAAEPGTLRLISRPPGALVALGQKVLCPATPCQVSWPPADGGDTHLVRLSRLGHRSSVVVVGPGRRQVAVTLRPLIEPAQVPGPSATASASQPIQTRTTNPEHSSPADSGQPLSGRAVPGYKKSPY